MYGFCASKTTANNEGVLSGLSRLRLVHFYAEPHQKLDIKRGNDRK